MTVLEVAEALGVTRARVNHLIKVGRLKPIPGPEYPGRVGPGRGYRIARSELERFRQERKAALEAEMRRLMGEGRGEG